MSAPAKTKKGQRVCLVVVDGQPCAEPHHGLDMCRHHYRQNAKWGDPLFVAQVQHHGRWKVCRERGCNGKHFTGGRCNKHHLRWKRRPQPVRTNLFDLDEARFLVEQGANLERVAQAFQVKPESVLTQLRRHRADDLAARLRERAA